MKKMEKLEKPIVFIGGSCGRIGELPKQFIALLELVMTTDSHIIIGDAPGTDSLVQDYLHKCAHPFVTIYYSDPACRYNAGGWPCVYVEETEKENGYWTPHMPKDIEMCRLCTYGLFLWNGQSRATQKNFSRLQAMTKKYITCHYGPTGGYTCVTYRVPVTDHVCDRTTIIPMTAHVIDELFDNREGIQKIGEDYIDNFVALAPNHYQYGP